MVLWLKACINLTEDLSSVQALTLGSSHLPVASTPGDLMPPLWPLWVLHLLAHAVSPIQVFTLLKLIV